MNKFEYELKNDNFVCSKCNKCDKLVWPPSDFCNSCFGVVEWKQLNRTAKLIEFSKKDDELFCIAEFEGKIRIVGRLQNSTDLKIGQPLILTKCDYDGVEKFFLEVIV